MVKIPVKSVCVELVGMTRDLGFALPCLFKGIRRVQLSGIFLHPKQKVRNIGVSFGFKLRPGSAPAAKEWKLVPTNSGPRTEQ